MDEQGGRTCVVLSVSLGSAERVAATEAVEAVQQGRVPVPSVRSDLAEAASSVTFVDAETDPAIGCATSALSVADGARARGESWRAPPAASFPACSKLGTRHVRTLFTATS